MAHFLLPTTTTLLLLLLLLLLLFSPLTTTTTTAPLTTTTTTAAVLDTDGNLVVANANYYILPVFGCGGGGVTRLPRNKTLCPLYVAQSRQEVSHGLPVKFYPINSKQLAVTLSTDLNIVFNAVTLCGQSNVWRLTTGSSHLVGVGGKIGFPGSQTLRNWFRIEKVGRYGDQFVYKIVFCPRVCVTCRRICGNVGVIFEDGRRFLGLNIDGHPLLVMFKKVSHGGTSSSI